jgi:hypothetical protein
MPSGVEGGRVVTLAGPPASVLPLCGSLTAESIARLRSGSDSSSGRCSRKSRWRDGRCGEKPRSPKATGSDVPPSPAPAAHTRTRTRARPRLPARPPSSGGGGRGGRLLSNVRAVGKGALDHCGQHSSERGLRTKSLVPVYFFNPRLSYSPQILILQLGICLLRTHAFI